MIFLIQISPYMPMRTSLPILLILLHLSTPLSVSTNPVIGTSSSRGYQPPPSGPLIDEYHPASSPFQPPAGSPFLLFGASPALHQPPLPPPPPFQWRPLVPSGDAEQPQPQHQTVHQQLAGIQQPQILQQQAQQPAVIQQQQHYQLQSVQPQQQQQQAVVQHVQRQPTEEGQNPVLINTLIQVFARKRGDRQDQGRAAIALAEAHTLTEERGQPNRVANGGGGGPLSALNGKHRVTLTRQLDTRSRTFLPKAALNPRAAPEEIAFVKAFAASNGTRMSEAELEEQLGRELDESIPLILEELGKAEEEEEGGGGGGGGGGGQRKGVAEATRGTPIHHPPPPPIAAEQQQQQQQEQVTPTPALVGTSELESLVGEGLEEFETTSTAGGGRGRGTMEGMKEEGGEEEGKGRTTEGMKEEGGEEGKGRTMEGMKEEGGEEEGKGRTMTTSGGGGGGSSKVPEGEEETEKEEEMTTTTRMTMKGPEMVSTKGPKQYIGETLAKEVSGPPEATEEAEEGFRTEEAEMTEVTKEPEGSKTEGTTRTTMGGRGGEAEGATTLPEHGLGVPQEATIVTIGKEEGGGRGGMNRTEEEGTEVEESTIETAGGTSGMAGMIPETEGYGEEGMIKTEGTKPEEEKEETKMEETATERRLPEGMTSSGTETGTSFSAGRMLAVEEGREDGVGGTTPMEEREGDNTSPFAGMGLEIARTEMAGGESGTTESAGGESGGTESGGEVSGRTESAGEVSGRTESAGGESGTMENAGVESGTTESAGGESGGTESAGEVSGRTESAGGESGGTESAGEVSGRTESAGGESGGTGSAGEVSGRTESAGMESETTESPTGGSETAEGATTEPERSSDVTHPTEEEEMVDLGSTGWGEAEVTTEKPWHEAEEEEKKGREESGTRQQETEIEGGGRLGVECVAPAGIRATLTPAPGNHSGRPTLFVKGFHDEPGCYTEAEGELLELEIRERQCGMGRMESTSPRGFNLSVVLIFASRRTLVLSPLEHSFLVQCFIPSSSSSFSSSHPLHTDLAILPRPRPISRTISLALSPPKCTYSLRRDSPNGPVVEKAQVGEIIFHRWECQGGKEAHAEFGMRVADCSVANHTDDEAGAEGKKPVAMVDTHGCSSDPFLLSHPQYSSGQLLAFSRAVVFSIRESNSLRFSCQLALCLRREGQCDGISPPNCSSDSDQANSSSSSSFSRRLHNEFDASMMAALSTEVLSPQFSVSSSSPSPSSLPHHHPSSSSSSSSSSSISRLPFGSSLSIALFLTSAVLLGALLGMTTFLISALRQQRRGRRVVQWVLARPREEDEEEEGTEEGGGDAEGGGPETTEGMPETVRGVPETVEDGRRHARVRCPEGLSTPLAERKWKIKTEESDRRKKIGGRKSEEMGEGRRKREEEC